jgi:hypothetical protein
MEPDWDTFFSARNTPLFLPEKSFDLHRDAPFLFLTAVAVMLLFLWLLEVHKNQSQGRDCGNNSRNQPAPLSQPKTLEKKTAFVKNADGPRTDKAISASENGVNGRFAP